MDPRFPHAETRDQRFHNYSGAGLRASKPPRQRYAQYKQHENGNGREFQREENGGPFKGLHGDTYGLGVA